MLSSSFFKTFIKEGRPPGSLVLLQAAGVAAAAAAAFMTVTHLSGSGGEGRREGEHDNSIPTRRNEEESSAVLLQHRQPAVQRGARMIASSSSTSTTTTSTPLNDFSPTSPVYVFQPNPNLEIAFCSRTRNPIYVLERLTTTRRRPSSSAEGPEGSPPENLQVGVSTNKRRPNINFYEEKSLPEEFRSRNSHYKNSGYDRGHLAAAANYYHSNNNNNANNKELLDTFNLINVSPQYHSMNASIWAKLERWTLKQVHNNLQKEKEETEDDSDTTDIYVVSGPIWMPNQQMGDKLFQFQYKAIGTPPSLVSVPTHFYKVVVAVTTTNSSSSSNGATEPEQQHRIVKFACFVIPNTDYSNNNQRNDTNITDGSYPSSKQRRQRQRQSLEDFLVPWNSLESVAGIHFFPLLTNQDPNWKERADLLTNDIISHNQQQKLKEKQERQRFLLTDGSTSSHSSSSSSSTGRRKKWRQFFKSTKEATTKPLAHFCANGGCR